MDTPLLTINGKDYVFVKKRSHMPVSIYKGEGEYLRIGPKDLIQQEIKYHKNLLHFGFPIPEILVEGDYQDQSYFTESSLGEEHLGQIFRTHCNNFVVQDSDFEKMLNVVKLFTKAQLKTVGAQSFSFADFKTLIHTDLVQEELPHLKNETHEAVSRAENRLKNVPSVLTHGDFNPYNIFEHGVIDWERGSYAPMGYDLTTNISQTFFFPLGGDFEATASCRFSPDQIHTYWKEMNVLCSEADIPSLTDYVNDYILFRSIWSVVRMDTWPKIQKWRYDQYEALLKAYLHDEDLTQFLLRYKA